MGASREARPSEQMLDNVFHELRNLDKQLWQGRRECLQETEEYVYIIKRDLDALLNQFKLEVGVAADTQATQVQSITPWDDSKFNIKPNPWKCTPLIDSNQK